MRVFVAWAVLAWALGGMPATATAEPRAPQVIDGNVIEIINGDTLVVVADGVKNKVRLLGIDAPEQGQPYFDDAIRVLSEKVMSRKVHVDVKGGDRASGYLGLVKQGDKSINRALVAEGAAWHDEQVPSPALKTAQEAAQQQKLGLWAAGEAPVSPWEFRGQQPDAKALADEKHKLREDEAAKAAGEFLTAWQGGAAPDDLLTTKGKEAEEEKKKAPSALAGAEIKPGKVQIRGNSADVLLNLTKGEKKLRGKVKLRSEQKKWLVMSVEIGSPPAILDFENTKSKLDKLQAALDKGFKEDDPGKGDDGDDSAGSSKGPSKGAAAEEPAEEGAASEEPESTPEPMPTESTAEEAPPVALSKAPPRGSRMGVKIQGNKPGSPSESGTASDSGTIRLVPKWSVSDRKSIEFRQTKHDLQDGKEVPASAVTLECEIEVMEASAAGYVLGWTDLRSKSVLGAASFDPTRIGMMNHALVLEIGPSGTLEKVRNWEEFRDRSLEAFGDSMEAAKKANPNLDTSKLEPLKALLEQTLGTEAAVRTEILKSKGAYFYFFGRDMKLGGKTSEDEEFSLPFGNVTIPCRADFTAASADEGPGLLNLECVRVFDKQLAAQRFDESMKAVVPAASSEADSSETTVDIEDRYSCLADVNSGWAPKAEVYRRFEVKKPPMAFVERTSFRILDSPPAEAETAAAPPEEPAPIRNPKFRNR